MLRSYTHDTVDGYDFTEDDAGSLGSAGGLFGLVGAYLIRFLVLMRGALTPPPRMDEPVTKIPLQCHEPTQPANKTKQRPTILHQGHSIQCTDQCLTTPRRMDLSPQGNVRH